MTVRVNTGPGDQSTVEWLTNRFQEDCEKQEIELEEGNKDGTLWSI